LLITYCFFSDEDEEAFQENEAITEVPHPYVCYHCEKRFIQKTSLKKHEFVHKNEKLVKIMKHPFILKDKWIMDTDEKIQKMIKHMPFLRRNILRSLKEQVNVTKGMFFYFRDYCKYFLFYVKMQGG